MDYSARGQQLDRSLNEGLPRKKKGGGVPFCLLENRLIPTLISLHQSDADNFDSAPQGPHSPILDTNFGNSSSDINPQYGSQGPHSPVLDTNFGNSSSDINSQNETHSEEPLIDLTGKYLLKIKEENRLTQTTIKKVALATSELFSVTCRRLKRKVEQILEDANIEEVPGLDAVFDEFISPFEDFQTAWMMSQFQRNEMSYVVSCSDVLSYKLLMKS